jgi:hypothetical protein
MDKFGLNKNAVINEKNTPGIWQSDFVDFPVDIQLGRILVSLSDGAIYLDTSLGRVIIVSGNSQQIFKNGITKTAVSRFGSNVELGGSLINDTDIDLATNLKNLRFIGNITNLNVTSDGYMKDENIGFYPIMVVDRLSTVTPNCVLVFYNPATSLFYKCLAQQL